MTNYKQALNSCILAAAAAILPAAEMPLSTWANDNLRLSSEASSLPGRFTCMPFQREPLDMLSPHSPFEQTVLEWASQMSKSTISLAMVAHAIDRDPGPCLVVEPTLPMAEAFSKDRLSPLFRDTPALRGKIADPKSRDAGSTVFHRRFTGGHVTVVGSNSPAGLASRPIRYLILDEVDRFEPSAGSEGDPASLAIARTRTFPANRKILWTSSPTVKDSSRIHVAFEESDQRYFNIPCPLCSVPLVLKWPRVEWPEGKPEDAAYRCEHCENLIPHHKKAWMLAAGRWVATRPGAKIAGFHLSELYSPWRDWGELAVDWLKAQGQPERLRSFINTSLAELWDDAGQTSVDQKTLMARRENWAATLPDGVAILTAGVDVQGDRLELELVGWGRGEESWNIEFRVFPGDPEGADVWKTLDEYLIRQYTHRLAGSLPIGACAIDSGFSPQSVYRFAGPRFGRRVFSIKGTDLGPVWPKKPTRKAGAKLYHIGTHAAKATIYGRLKLADEGPGYCHFPVDRGEEYFEQLLSEYVATTFKKGRPVREWRRRKGARAEALDCRVYAFAALQARISMGLRLDDECDRLIGQSMASNSTRGRVRFQARA